MSETVETIKLVPRSPELERDFVRKAADKACAYFARPDAKRFYVFPVSRSTDPEPFAAEIRKRGFGVSVEPSREIECEGTYAVTFPMIRVSRPPEGWR